MSFSINYTVLTQMLQDWPVESNTDYINDIPLFVQMGESRLITDLNLDIFDNTDATQTLAVAEQLIDKPTDCMQLRAMRLAPITSTTFTAAAPTAFCLSFMAAIDPTTQTLTGTLGPAPATVSPAAQASVTQTAGDNGVSVQITGLDQNSVPTVEVINPLNGQTIIGFTRWSKITDITTYGADGDTQAMTIGTAAVTTTVLGISFPVVKRSKDFCDAFNADPAVVGPPRYFNEYSTVQWQLVLSADIEYGVILHYIIQPESIVTAGTTWLGTFCGELLFLASLMEAERFLKADDRFDDIAGDYNQKLATRRQELRDSIRAGDYSPVKPAATVIGK